MSKEAPIGLTIMEKLLGLLIILVGFIMFYITYTNVASIGSAPTFFLALGIALIVLGVFVLIAKPE